jgi:hypothetical protein
MTEAPTNPDAIGPDGTVQPDTCTAEAIERDGPAPETQAGLPD